jgi:hypothetical protein
VLISLLLLQVIQDLTAASTADLLAVGLNLATAAQLDVWTAGHLEWLVMDIQSDAPAACLHEAVEALLRLFIQLCKTRPHLAGAAAAGVRGCLIRSTAFLSEMPGAEKLPAGTVVELVELVLQVAAVGSALEAFYLVAEHLLHLLRSTMPSHRLTPAHVKRLLALLQGPTAAAATLAYQCIRVGGAPSVMVWLGGQPGAAAAAAELGLTAADVPDLAAAALLFGGQPDQGDG